MDTQSFTMLMNMITRIENNQEDQNRKLDDINKALSCYCNRTEQLEKKLEESILLPKMLIKIASIPAIGTIIYKVLEYFHKS